MLNFLAPGAWFGLLALAIPAVLHLRRPPPPTVRVGTLRHLKTLPRLRPRWWRWRDLARLALRLALLALLTMALTRPFWRWPADLSPRRWSLVDPAGVLTGAPRERLEARRAAGDEVRSLAPDGATVDLWSQLRELDARLPAGSALTVFSPARLDALRGDRPTLGNVAVEWVETPAANFPALPDRAGILPRGGVPHRTDDLRFVPRFPAGDAEPGKVRDDTEIVRPNTPSEPRESSSAAPALRVLILHSPDRAGDARRLATAVRIATPPETVVNVNPGPDAHAPALDWVFCLGTPPPETPARNVFTDAGDSPPTGEGPSPGRLVAPELGNSEVLLRRCVPLPADSAAAVYWTDSLGRPVLTVTPPDAAGQRRWRFGSRFDPAWNDLPGTTALTETLRAWFFPPKPGAPDPRLAGAGQALPRPGKSAGGRPAWPWPGVDDARPAVDLRPWALALASLGFLLERFWAFRRPATNAAP